MSRSRRVVNQPTIPVAPLRLVEPQPRMHPSQHGQPLTTTGYPYVVTIPRRGITLEEIERQAIVEALRQTYFVQKDAAALLGISERVISYRIQILNIDIEQEKAHAQF